MLVMEAAVVVEATAWVETTAPVALTVSVEMTASEAAETTEVCLVCYAAGSYRGYFSRVAECRVDSFSRIARE